MSKCKFYRLKILLKTLDFSFDVLGLTETWLNESNEMKNENA